MDLSNVSEVSSERVTFRAHVITVAPKQRSLADRRVRTDPQVTAFARLPSAIVVPARCYFSSMFGRLRQCSAIFATARVDWRFSPFSPAFHHSKIYKYHENCLHSRHSCCSFQWILETISLFAKHSVLARRTAIIIQNLTLVIRETPLFRDFSSFHVYLYG